MPYHTTSLYNSSSECDSFQNNNKNSLLQNLLWMKNYEGPLKLYYELFFRMCCALHLYGIVLCCIAALVGSLSLFCFGDFFLNELGDSYIVVIIIIITIIIIIIVVVVVFVVVVDVAVVVIYLSRPIFLNKNSFPRKHYMLCRPALILSIETLLQQAYIR